MDDRRILGNDGWHRNSRNGRLRSIQTNSWAILPTKYFLTEVPQGSVLEPSLYLYTFDLHTCRQQCNLESYALYTQFTLTFNLTNWILYCTNEIRWNVHRDLSHVIFGKLRIRLGNTSSWKFYVSTVIHLISKYVKN